MLIGQVQALAAKHGFDDIQKALARSDARRLLNDLDECYANKLRRRARKVVFRTGRRTQRKPKASVGEAYCPERLTAVCADYGLDPKFAMDLTTYDASDGQPWDFEVDEVQAKALKRLEEQDPGLVLVSPECGPFCTVQSWNYP